MKTIEQLLELELTSAELEQVVKDELAKLDQAMLRTHQYFKEARSTSDRIQLANKYETEMKQARRLKMLLILMK